MAHILMCTKWAEKHTLGITYVYFQLLPFAHYSRWIHLFDLASFLLMEACDPPWLGLSCLPVSNQGSFACKVNVLTTTPQRHFWEALL